MPMGTVVDAPTTPVPGMGWGGGGASNQRSADAHVIVMKIPHHEGARAMSELALSWARRPQIKALAQRIIASQSHEMLKTAPDFDRAFIEEMAQCHQQWFGPSGG